MAINPQKQAANDTAVLKAYGWPTDLSEPEIVSRLFAMYAKLTEVVVW